MRCYKCGSFTTFKVYFEESAKTVMRFCCAPCFKDLKIQKIVVHKELPKKK